MEEKDTYGPLDPRAVLGRSSGDISSLSLEDKLECVPPASLPYAC